ncbi:glycoside hydrolase family 65 protein [Companilactobacillus suantsaicola]|nr:glycoside hydrolase family 65 protein [Companilactobacillus suantsaicola]
MTNNWQITYKDMPTGSKSYGQEALLTLGNGYLGWRGAPLMSRYNADHYPGLYVAGVFNQTTTNVNGHDVVNEDIVNFPNPQLLKVKVDNVSISVPYHQRLATLDLKTGELIEELVYPVASGHLFVKTTKVVDPDNYHRFALKVELRLDFSARVQVDMLIDGDVKNQNVVRYRDFNSQEFSVEHVADQVLQGQTLQSKIKFAIGARTVSEDGDFTTSATLDTVDDQLTLDLAANQTLQFSRVMAISTSYEDQNFLKTVQDALTHTFEEIDQNSRQHWQEFWIDGDVVLDSDDPDIQKVIRLNIFQLHQAASKNNQDLDASIGSRGLTGEGYRGHIFWDELFVIPYLAKTNPVAAKAILKYRIKRLPAARKNAQAQMEHGAMYPWQSASLGDEQAQFIHLNPISNQWYPDNSRLQRHVSLAVVYDLWSYTHITGDYSLMTHGGLEVLLLTSKFWLEKLEYDGQNYHLSGVMGPDEYHEAYPDTKQGGLSDNAYTNLMLVWSLMWLLDLQEDSPVYFQQICQKVGFSTDLLEKAAEVTHRLKVFTNQEGIIEQYNHYFELKDLNLTEYAKKYGDIHRIDRILTSENKSANNYQVDKQADTLMMIYNFGPQVMANVLKKLGVSVSDDWLTKNRDYYLARTVHGSTMSRPVYASIDANCGDSEAAWKKLQIAIRSDYDDIQGGTTAEGIHIGVMGSTLTVMMRDLAGVKLIGSELTVDPKLPKTWHKLSFSQKYRGNSYHFTFEHNTVTVSAEHSCLINIKGKEFKLESKQAVTY